MERQHNAQTSTPASTQATLQPRALVLNNIAVTGVGLNCVAGSEPFALFGAVGTNLGFTRPDPVLETLSLTGEGVESVMTCAMAELDAEDPHERMMACMIPALIDVMESAKLLDRPRKNILFYLVVPSTETARGDCLQMDELHQFLQDELADLGDVEIRIKGTTQSVTEHLMFVSEGLQNRNWDTVIFGAVDSLVDELTCMDLGKQMRIQTMETADGVIPGEAAGFIVLERVERIRSVDELPLGWLKGLCVQPEPAHGKADMQRLNGLGQAFNSVLTACALAKEKVNSMILAMGTEQTDLIEWHQTETQLWPNKASEAEMTALRLGEVDMIDPPAPQLPEKLNLNLSLGEVGVASVPVSIILAVARFEFQHPISKRCLIMEAGDTPHRGVIYIKHPTNGRQLSQLLDDAA